MKQFVMIRNAAAIAFVVAATACSSSSPVNPTQTAAASTAATGAPASVTFTDGKTSVTLTAPQAVSPADNQQIRYIDQPVTLTVKNAVSTKAGTTTYTFQVASDAAFATIVSTKDGVAEGAGGQTSQKLDTLTGAKTYFWRVSATSGGTAGPFSKARTLIIGPPIVLSNPAGASPAANATVAGAPQLVVNNIGRTGPAGAITYKFDLSDSSSFAKIVFTSTVGEGSGLTSVTVPSTVASGTYFWRVQAFDTANGLSTAVSPTLSFVYQAFTMAQATIVSSPLDLATWGETAKITSIVFTGDAFLVDFNKRDGPDRWPDTPFGTAGGNLEYTLGLCGFINGHWYCSAVVQFWYGRELAASGLPSAISYEWFYDPARWGPMTGWQPQEGETVGVFVCAGNCRNNTAGDNSYVKERSNVAFVPWTFGGASYSLSSARKSLTGQ